LPTQNDEQKDVQQALSENVNERLVKAMEDLKEKHRTGANDVDDPDRAPTGPVYRAISQQQAALQHQQEQRQQLKSERERQITAHRVESVQRHMKQQELNDDDDDDSDYDDLLDDPVLDTIRQKRMQEMRNIQMKKVENLARGHGQYRTIRQDDFLPECSGSSEWVAVHFFHQEFERCKILDHHLQMIALQHTTCKFLRIDAEKAPFFVAKLQIKTLPTLLVFRDGKTTDRLMGFEGLSKDPKNPDKWETRRLQEWLAGTGAIEYMPSKEELLQEMRSLGMGPKTTVRRGGVDYYDEEY
jgi:thiol-disulfide isomerase/thioredoxin